MANPPLLYIRTKEQIAAYRAMPAEQKVRKLEMEMELMYYMRQERARFAVQK
ncbi:MAG: hypothetical protein JJE30_01415 [Desulfuromonadales bacterium]|nr:hypothetical protein [Desulfuromonadales bacterium]